MSPEVLFVHKIEVASRTRAGHVELVTRLGRQTFKAAAKIELPVFVAKYNTHVLEVIHTFARPPIERRASVLVALLIDKLHHSRIGMDGVGMILSDHRNNRCFIVPV